MAFPNTSAGVYDQDRDLSQRGGTVISSIASMVTEAAKGKVGEWVDIFDKENAKQTFGTKSLSKYGFGLYCAEQYLRESRMMVKRVVDPATARTAGAWLSVDDIDATNPVIKLVCFDEGTNQPKGALGDPMETVDFLASNPGAKNALLFVCANSPGEWSDELSIRIRPSAPLGTEVGQYSDPYHFYLEVFVNYKGDASIPVESYLCSRTSEVDGEGGQMYVEDRVNAFSQYIKVKNNKLCPPVQIRTTAFEYIDGGEDGNRPTAQQIAEAWEGLEDTDTYETQILLNAGYTTPVVQQRMITTAEKRGDAIAIIDLPKEMAETARAVNYRRNTLNVSSSYGAMYAPFVEVTDEITGRRFFCPPSALVGAQFAYTDRVRAYYWAPAGITRGQMKVTDLFKKYNKQERNAMEQAQINIIRRIPGRGFVIFDQQTLQTFASGFQNVNVRRLVNGIKSIVRKAFLPSVFNPNDEFERLKLKNLVDAEVRTIKTGRGVYEWETICDERNNTKDVIANNDMVIDLILDPSIPAKRAHIGADIRNFGDSISFRES